MIELGVPSSYVTQALLSGYPAAHLDLRQSSSLRLKTASRRASTWAPPSSAMATAIEPMGGGRSGSFDAGLETLKRRMIKVSSHRGMRTTQMWWPSLMAVVACWTCWTRTLLKNDGS